MDIPGRFRAVAPPRAAKSFKTCTREHGQRRLTTLLLCCRVTVRLTTLLLTLTVLAAPAFAADYWVYFGTGAEGIYRSRFDPESGAVTAPEKAASITRPNFLAVHPSSNYLYAAARTEADGRSVDAAAAFSINRSTGELTPINLLRTRGPGSCHLNVDPTGRTLALANYSGGSVETMTLAPDGRLIANASFFQHEGSGAHPRRQDKPHAHSVNFSPDGRFLIVADLGLDKLLVYRVDPANGKLTPNQPPSIALAPGAGPRHFVFHPDQRRQGRYAYVLNELASTITALLYDAAAGSFTKQKTVSTLPADFSGDNSTAEVLIHPNGKFLYASNRGHNSIAVFAIGGAGELNAVQRASTLGDWPRNFRLDPTGKFLFAANQRSDSVVVFRISSETGRLAPTGTQLEAPSPLCVRFVAAVD